MYKVLFRRNYTRLAGGHLKVFDYFNHLKTSDKFHPYIYVKSNNQRGHLWDRELSLVDRYDPEDADILFIAGKDWAALDEYPGIEERKPVINLIQGLRHADPGTEQFAYLNRKAIRICVSDEVKSALEATRRCNGPLFAIPNGVDLQALAPPSASPATDVFIAGLKQPQLARSIADRLLELGYTVDCQLDHVPRDEFLLRMARCRIALTLPLAQEGFFLPPLEAMAMERIVICPDCGGNRSFCIDGQTAIVPQRKMESLERAVVTILSNPALGERLKKNGTEMSRRHDLKHERELFLGILERALIN